MLAKVNGLAATSSSTPREEPAPLGCTVQWLLHNILRRRWWPPARDGGGSRAGNETKVTRRDEIETAGHETRRDTRRLETLSRDKIRDETKKFARKLELLKVEGKNFGQKFKYF